MKHTPTNFKFKMDATEAIRQLDQLRYEMDKELRDAGAAQCVECEDWTFLLNENGRCINCRQRIEPENYKTNDDLYKERKLGYEDEGMDE